MQVSIQWVSSCEGCKNQLGDEVAYSIYIHGATVVFVHAAYTNHKYIIYYIYVDICGDSNPHCAVSMAMNGHLDSWEWSCQSLTLWCRRLAGIGPKLPQGHQRGGEGGLLATWMQRCKEGQSSQNIWSCFVRAHMREVSLAKPLHGKTFFRRKHQTTLQTSWFLQGQDSVLTVDRQSLHSVFQKNSNQVHISDDGRSFKAQKREKKKKTRAPPSSRLVKEASDAEAGRGRSQETWGRSDKAKMSSPDQSESEEDHPGLTCSYVGMAQE